MSYDMGFDCGPLDAKHQERGGTYEIGGTTEPHLNITYNYSQFFFQHWPNKGIRCLYGLTAAQVSAEIEKVLPAMRGEPSVSYWDATEGNAKAALQSLLRLADLCPENAVLSGD